MVHLKEETIHLKLDLKFSRLFRLYFVLQCFIWTLAFLNCQINFQFYFSPETFNWVIQLIKYFQYFRSVQFIVIIDPNSHDLSDTILLSFVCVCVYVWTGLVCVMCFVPTPSVSCWKAGLPSGLISSPQTVDCDSFRNPRLTHLKPIDVALNVNFCRFNSSPSSTYCC